MARRENFKKITVAAALAIGQIALFTPYAVEAAVSISGNPLFTVSAAGGLSASAREGIVQKNLDNALVALQGRAGNVGVVNVRGIPVVTLGGYHVITVDKNTARAMGMTPTALANLWAGKLRTALNNSASVDAHIASIVGDTTFAATIPDEEQFVSVPQTTTIQLPVGMRLPVTLLSGINARTTEIGDVIQARLSSDINLGGGQVVPAGTLVLGRVTPAPYGGNGAVQVNFDQLRLANGATIPISASIVGGVRAEQERSMLGGLQQNTLGRVVTRGAVGAGLGAALGTGIGAIVAGSSRRVSAGKGLGTGAWMGAAIGGGLGALSGLLLRPNTSVAFPAGQSLVLELNAPASVAVQGGYF